MLSPSQGCVTKQVKWWPVTFSTQSLFARGLKHHSGRQTDGGPGPRGRYLTHRPLGSKKPKSTHSSLGQGGVSGQNRRTLRAQQVRAKPQRGQRQAAPISPLSCPRCLACLCLGVCLPLLSRSGPPSHVFCTTAYAAHSHPVQSQFRRSRGKISRIDSDWPAWVR